MTQEHPINPPPELVEQWMYVNNIQIAPLYMAQAIATQAARWGADTELDACCECINDLAHGADVILADLRAARRPKPLSLKEKALLQLDTLNADLGMHGLGCDLSQIRRALESLPD